MATADFSLQDKLGMVRFFQETFLVADTRMEGVLGMLFLTFGSADLRFAEEELVWRTYTAAETLPNANDQAGGTLQCKRIYGVDDKFKTSSVDTRSRSMELVVDDEAFSPGQAEADLRLFCFDLDDKVVLASELP